MDELLEKEQIMSVVPRDYRKAVKGKVIGFDDKFFEMEVVQDPKGIPINHLTEFYSQTKHGVLYFQSDVVEIKDKILKIASPVKHRFLQRRQFTRIAFVQDIELKAKKKKYKIQTIDISAGGLKIKAEDNINIDDLYEAELALLDDQKIKFLFEPIRIEKQDEKTYTLSGRFKNMSNIDKMTLVQFCLKSKMETGNR